mmetsp:Transcript_24291/g.46098  ORF Transcript_24291/g.46098 Transcript_24291/m.46098 type:complete len:523 (+) Transcript_24291:185-1753(+)|eukprot:CAMPEP_0114252798 /NCGR_PEP_ID=MMETSP0058-20121206/16040_1 /TAXON_ID=36894 /ORGANISM="Pyramimonas parkeae, CCMP726" /LENGTH=522 /DNA_ID=CAMNT_0001366779 /DNA_START=166 /DNA_END=1734 /DNA_ORIENTATION=-
MGNCCGGEAKQDEASGNKKPHTASTTTAVTAGPPGAPGTGKPKLLHVGSILQREVEELHHHYVLGKELGRGQFGITHLCQHKETKKLYACKSISKQRKIVTKEDGEDVRREVAIMYHLQGHPNICDLVAAYEDKANVHLVMELCQGGELFDRIVEKGCYSELNAANVFRTIMTVVAQCHALGVMHRDLKPENFLLSDKTENAKLKATDFGLSMFFKPNQVFREVVGSAYYVAPEVLKRYYSLEADVWSAGVILYILLCGVPPFWHETEQGIFDAVRRGQYDITNKPWDKISRQAKDLVQKLLVINPKQRLTAQQALQHPWLREGGEAPDTVLDDTVLSRLKKFSGMNRLKKMALNVIAKNMSQHEIEGLSEMFKAFDRDNSGTITMQELKEGLKKMGNPLTEQEVDGVMAQIDIDGDGIISYDEFIAATMHMNKLNSEENLWKAFATFDADDSGFITPDELRDALIKHGMDVEGMDDILNDVDQDGDGRINYDEFVHMMRSNNPTGPALNLNLKVEDVNVKV